MSNIRHEQLAPTSTFQHGSGDVVDRHRHDEHQLIYVSRGVVAVRTSNAAWVASSDRAIWVPAHTWHEHRFYGESRFHTVGFDTVHPSLPADRPAVVSVDPLLRQLLIELTIDELSDREARHIRAVVTDRLRNAAHEPLMLPVPTDPRLVDACDLVETDLSTPRSLGWLATRVNTSERTLSRLFRSEFGMSYPQWRTRTRLFSAMVLLHQGSSVTRTAHATGWATTSAFVDTFANALGVTPGAYRHT